MKKKRHKNLLLIYAILPLLCAIITFALFFFIYLRRFDNTMTEENRSRLSEVSSYIVSYIQHMLNHQQTDLKLVAEAAALIGDEQTRLDYLTQMSSELGFEYIGIAGEDGLLISTALKDPLDIKEESYFKEALLGKSQISDLTRQIFDDHAVGGVIIAVPYTSQNTGALVALLDINSLGDGLEVVNLNAAGNSYIIDKQGNLILHAKSMEYNNYLQYLKNMDFAEGCSYEQASLDLLNEREGMITFSDFGVEKYAYYRPLNLNGWMVVSSVPKGMITQKTDALSRELTLMVLAAFLLFTILLTAVCILLLQLVSRRRANQAKSSFLANMSHDMRTPMNAIIGMATIAASHIQEQEKVRDCLTKILQSSKHLLRLINDILDMSQVESGKMVLHQETLSLPEFLDDVLDMIFPSVQAKNLQLTVSLHKIVHEEFLGDSLRLSQIMINILTNAVKFTPAGGRIEVEIEELPAETENTVRYRFQISDNGMGMKEEFLKQIFTAFSREKDSRIDKIEGSGLGMAITKKIVDLMNGSIDVSSAPAKGTSFHFTLSFPLCNKALSISPVPSCSILLIDEDIVQSAETIRLLNDCGIHAQLETDSEAVSQWMKTAASENGQALILIDYASFHLLPSLPPSHPPVLLMAYHWEETDNPEIAQVLKKPLFRQRIALALSEFLNTDQTEKQISATAVFDLNEAHILLVEDNELNCEIAQSLLEEANAKITVATNGLECINLLKKESVSAFDLILMDIQMPEMNGYDAARAIRQMNSEGASVPILAMSANAFEEDKKAAAEAGMNGYLTKPIDLALWIKEISAVLPRDCCKMDL